MAMNDYERYGSFFGAPNINYRDGVNIARPKTVVPQVEPAISISNTNPRARRTIRSLQSKFPNETAKALDASKRYIPGSRRERHLRLNPQVIAEEIADIPEVSTDRGVFNPYDLYRNPAGYTPGVPEVPPSTFTPKGKRVSVGSGKATSRAKIADEDFSIFDDIREGRTTFNKAFPTKRAPLSSVIPLPV